MLITVHKLGSLKKNITNHVANRALNAKKRREFIVGFVIMSTDLPLDTSSRDTPPSRDKH